jgi:small subunit ribosomal protein S16
VAVKIRLKRMGKIRQPYYRVVVVDARKKRDGRVIEEIGKYHPKEEPSFIEVVSDRAQYWLGVGAQPSDAVAALLKVTGDWQKFKGLPGTEGTLRTKEPKRDKQELFNEALKDAANEPKGDAVTKKKASAKKMAPSSTEPADTAEPADKKAAKTAEAKPEAPAAEAVPEAAPEAPAAEASTEAAATEETPADESAVTTEAAAEADVAEQKTEA